jgi:hypothetical protein
MPENRIGKKYGRLVVIAKSPRSWKKKTYWECLCDCGKVCAPRSDALSSGASQSCGCRQKEIAKKLGGWNASNRANRTTTYSAWQHMKSRCSNPKNPDFKHYGGRGIEVCSRWLNSFESFLNDMGKRPEGLSLDRKNTNGGYSPENCRWATAVEQNRNRRHSIFIPTAQGAFPLAEFAERNKMSYKDAYQQLRDGRLFCVRPNVE